MPKALSLTFVVALFCGIAAMSGARGAEDERARQEVPVGVGTTTATTTGSSGPSESDKDDTTDTSGKAASGDTTGSDRGGSDGGLSPGAPSDTNTNFRCEVIRDPAARATCEERARGAANSPGR